MDQIEEARAYYDRVLEGAPSAFERDNPMPARAMVNAAVLRYRTGDMQGAERLLRDAIAWFAGAVGEDDPEMLDAKTSLAVILNELGRQDEAAELHKAVLESSRRRFGAEDPRTLVAQTELGAFLRDLGRHDEAYALFAAALPAQRRVMGETDQVLLSVYQYVGLLTRMERWEEALRESEWLVARIDSALPPSHPVAMLGHFRLGAALTGLGRFEEAERALLESWRRLEGVEGISPEWKGYVAEAAAAMYEKWERAEQASDWRAILEGLRSPSPGQGDG
jgi:tetratricopeptide (TPR) repeat protein